jgi:hypothetical protein
MNHAEIAYIVKRVLTEPCEDTKELLLRFEKNIRDKENNMENEIIVVHSREPLVEQGQELLEAIDENDDKDEIMLTESVFKELEMIVKDI